MNTLKKSWMNFANSSLLYQTITKNELGYFQVNSEILETRISSSSKFVPQKDSSSIFKFEPEKVQEVQVFSYQVILSLLPSLVYTIKKCPLEFTHFEKSVHEKSPSLFEIAGIKKLLNAGSSLCVNGVLYDDVMDSFSNADIMFVLQFRDTNIWGLLPQMQGFPGLLLQTCAFRAPS